MKIFAPFQCFQARLLLLFGSPLKHVCTNLTEPFGGGGGGGLHSVCKNKDPLS